MTNNSLIQYIKICPKLKEILSNYTPKGRKSRFHISWFEKNKMYGEHLLNFSSSIMELLDPSLNRILCKRKKGKLYFEFWPCINGKKKQGIIKPMREIIISEKGFILSIPKKLCIADTYLWAIALRLEFFKIPRYWRTLLKSKNNGREIKLRYNEEKNKGCWETRDPFYHSVKIELEHFKDQKFKLMVAEYNRLSNLKQMKTNTKLLLLTVKKNVERKLDNFTNTK